MSYCLFDDDNEYEAEYRCTDIINQRAYQSRYNNGTGKPDDTGGQGTGEPVVSNAGDPTSVSLNDFVGDYRGINLFFVVDWETYEMSEDVDHSSLSFVKAEDGYELKNIVIHDIRAPKRHKTLNPVVLHDSDMAYYLDTDTNEDDPIPWDCLIIETDYADIIFSKWQKNGQLMITIDIGDGVPQVFIPQAA
ncbi:MAG: hypothetical protein E7422_09665 [Ruminococcaceae bacterium]|nr:hypothetical protein [Oscillospiraceae bacterium]